MGVVQHVVVLTDWQTPVRHKATLNGSTAIRNPLAFENQRVLNE